MSLRVCLGRCIATCSIASRPRRSQRTGKSLLRCLSTCRGAPRQGRRSCTGQLMAAHSTTRVTKSRSRSTDRAYRPQLRWSAFRPRVCSRSKGELNISARVGRRHHKRPSAAGCLDVDELELRVKALKLSLDVEIAFHEIHVLPQKSERLALSEPHCQGH